MRFTSPLRYPGGKGKLTNFVRLLFEENNLIDGHYVEPFAGGASIALGLLFNEYVFKIYINDINKSIYAFWYSVLYNTEKLCRSIFDTSVNIDEWHKQKLIQLNPEEYSRLQLGFSTFFLNRTNRSGILKGGVIGGKKQDGKWKLDARYNKIDLIKRIEKIALYKNRINIYNLNASDFIKNILFTIPDNTLIYLDPPYYLKGQDLYENHYKPNDHVSLSELVANKIKQNWIVSYDNVPEICSLYSNFRQISYNLSYSAASRYKGSEILFFCNQLSIPFVSDPVKISIF